MVVNYNQVNALPAKNCPPLPASTFSSLANIHYHNDDDDDGYIEYDEGVMVMMIEWKAAKMAREHSSGSIPSSKCEKCGKLIST